LRDRPWSPCVRGTQTVVCACVWKAGRCVS
jgi:hypothetical protein